MGMTTLALGLAMLGAVATTLAVPRTEQQGTPAQSVPSAQPEPGALLEVYWKLVSVADVKAVAQPGGREPHIVFRAMDSVTGSDGCNTINGSYTLSGESLKLGPLMGTLMSCATTDRLDRRFREALIDTRSWKITNGELLLLDENSKVLARLERRVDQ